MQDFTDVWNAARKAAQLAAEVENLRLGPEGNRGFDCGFAWVAFPGNIPFAKWAKAKGLASKAYPSGMHIWYSKVHDIPTQSISVHEAACKAARDVLAHSLQTSMISMGSRLD